MNLAHALVLSAMTGTALMAGLFFAFSTAVLGSLERMPPGQGARAMTLINARIQNPLFLAVFMVTALVCLTLIVLAVLPQSSVGGWAVAGSLLHLIGCTSLTAAVNVPLNNRLDAVDPATAGGQAEWTRYLRRWSPANGLRTLTCTFGVVAFGLALTGTGG